MRNEKVRRVTHVTMEVGNTTSHPKDIVKKHKLMRGKESHHEGGGLRNSQRFLEAL